MADVTARWSLPYPEGPDTPPSVHTAIQDLAEALDNVAMDAQGVLASRPAASSTNEGSYYWGTDTGLLYRSNGTTWDTIGPGEVADNTITTAKIVNDAVTDAKLADHATDDVSRAVGTNHIKDLAVTSGKLAASAVTLAKLADALKPSGTAAPGDEALRAIGSTGSTVVAGNDARLSAGAAGVATVRALGTSAGEAAPGDDVRITSSFGATRLAVRGVATSNINIVSAPATISGITPANGDRFLLVGQTTGSQNGIRVWTSAGAAMARATDMDSSGDLQRGVLVHVLDGTAGVDQNTTWALTTSGALTLDTTSLTFQAVEYFGHGPAATQPSASVIAPGGMFYTTDTGVLYRRDGSSWQTVTIGSSSIASGAVTEAKLGSNSVTSAKILDAAITDAKILDGAVTTAKILDEAVTAAKLASESITAPKYGVPPIGRSIMDVNYLQPNDTTKDFVDSTGYVSCPGSVGSLRAEVAGWYKVSGRVGWALDADGIRTAWIAKEGVEIVRSNAKAVETGGSNAQFTICDIPPFMVECAENDDFTLNCRHTAGNDLQVLTFPYTYLQLEYVGPA
jgi:hypothetical protein